VPHGHQLFEVMDLLRKGNPVRGLPNDVRAGQTDEGWPKHKFLSMRNGTERTSGAKAVRTGISH
jgi:hypothetical protein